jgi:hypothetical protein
MLEILENLEHLAYLDFQAKTVYQANRFDNNQIIKLNYDLFNLVERLPHSGRVPGKNLKMFAATQHGSYKFRMARFAA